MKTITLPLFSAFLAASLSASAQATVIADWDFEFSIPTFTGQTGPVSFATTGTGTLQGFHVDSRSEWISSGGNGSLGSYAVNYWTVGDYYQFSTSTTGYESITLSVDQSSTNGPRDFQLSYSTDGTNFTDFGPMYAIPRNTPSAGTWNPTTRRTNAIFPFDLSGITALNDADTVYFRLTQATNISSSGGTNTDGRAFLDNVTVSGIAIVPEPSAALLLGAGGVLPLLLRRRSDLPSQRGE